jgi:hypothetical protein
MTAEDDDRWLHLVRGETHVTFALGAGLGSLTQETRRLPNNR